MVTELFGLEILNATVDEVKNEIRTMPPAQRERSTYILHDWAAATGKVVSASDYQEVEAYNKEK